MHSITLVCTALHSTSRFLQILVALWVQSHLQPMPLTHNGPDHAHKAFPHSVTVIHLDPFPHSHWGLTLGESHLVSAWQLMELFMHCCYHTHFVTRVHIGTPVQQQGSYIPAAF
jgi:hypothetical protein